jgi:tetratricopeptide (TPR) repeat protein
VQRQVVVLAMVLALARGAGGDPPEAEARARALFDTGQAAYAAGRYLDAARSFEEAHAIVHNHKLLWNIARAYQKHHEYDRNLNHLRRARDGYRSFAELTTVDAERAEALALVEDLARQIRAAESAVTSPAAVGPPVPPVTKPVAAPPQITSPSPAPAPPPRKRWPLWLGVGVAVGVVVAAGVTAGAVLGTRAPAGTQLPAERFP